MKTKSFICAGLVFISSLGWSESKDVITVAGFEIPGVMEPKLTGSYDRVFTEVFSHLPTKVKYVVVPTARADSLFSDNAVDCVAPMDIRYSKIQEMVVNSKPINIAKIYIYSRNREGPWTSLQDIEGKRVGIKNGLWYGPKWSDKKMHVEAVASDEQNIEKLKKGRIDAFLAYVPDMTVLKHEIRKQRPSLPIPEIRCPRLEDFRIKRGGQSVSLVFSSYYVNNPSSSFGHTLLRINRKAGADGRRFELLDYGFNFAAQATSTNPLVYSVKGLFGGFDGVFSSLPYYFKVREYNQAEARDLWEYELNLSADEVSMLVDHLWEVGPQKIDYWYLTENCAYFMLTLLEAGAPQWNLDRAMKTYVIPSDTIRLVAEQPGLVRRISFRPSIRREFLTRFQLLNDEQKRATIEGAKALGDSDRAQTYSFGSDPMIYDALLDYIDMTYAVEIQMENTNAKHMRDRLLSQRSRLPSTPELNVPVPESERPDLGHSSRRTGLGLKNKTDTLSSQSKYYLDISYRFAHHDLLDPIVGYPRDARIQFFDFSGYLDQSQLHVEDWTMIGIQSLNPVSVWDKNMSWEFNMGLEDDEFFRLRLGGGYSARFDQLLFYGGIQALAGTQLGISTGQTTSREAQLLTHAFVQYILNSNVRTMGDILGENIKLGIQYDLSEPTERHVVNKSIRFQIKKTNHDLQSSLISVFYL